MSRTIQRVRTVRALPTRPVDGHKGTFGRVLVVGGSVGMAGAPALVGLAALRSGAGLVTIAVPASIQPTVAGLCPCATTIGLPDNTTGQIDPVATKTLFNKLGIFGKKKGIAPPNAVVIGPGVGQGSVTYARAFWKLIDGFRSEPTIPTVIDADALNLAAAINVKSPQRWDRIRHPQTIITPHPGELARMLDTNTAAIQADRESVAVDTAARMNARQTNTAVVVLKGAGTIVTDGSRVYTNRTGNPGMATGGSGDVLGGMIAALCAQSMTCFDAAATGAYLHGLAGDLAAQLMGQVSLVATDIIDALPAAFTVRYSNTITETKRKRRPTTKRS